MIVLGIGAEGDSGAAIVEDGRILAAINEERLCRMKLVEGFPRGAIREVLRLSGRRVEDLDAVLVGATNSFLVDELHPFDGWSQNWSHTRGFASTVKRMAGKLSRYGKRFPLLQKGYYALLWPSFAKRRRGIRRILRDEFGVRCPVQFVDHHFCHVASAYFTSGFQDALIVSLDGGGDGRSGLLYAARRGRLDYLHEISAYNSLGNYYAYVTHICGFKAQRHEGKITGLAAHGEPVFLPLLRECIQYEDGTFLNKAGLVFWEAIRDLQRRLPDGWRREDLAASIQRHFEDLIPRLVRHWSERTGLSDVALAGGVFANVRVNEELLGLEGVSRVFVHPGMTDGGLPVGAALAACARGVLKKTMPSPTPAEPLHDVYLGSPLDEDEVRIALRERELVPEPMNGSSLEEEVADLLARGHVVARAEGRMEYGPRALGNRSILYRPDDRSVNDWLNKSLRRTEFMPFAPAVLYEERQRCFENGTGGEHTAEFMTITFHCTPWMREHMPGVVHVDGTARPQLVKEDVNPPFYRIIDAFRQRTGLPAIINTSFNIHEEPIVCTPRDCVRAFLDAELDYLALGPHLIRHPRLSVEVGSRRMAAAPPP